MNQAETLQAKIIQKNLNVDAKIFVFESIDSTNLFLKTSNHTQTQICLAEEQTQGRGRGQRHWHSPKGLNLYFSVKRNFAKPLADLSGLSMVAALSVCQCLIEQTNIHFQLKWPNDILFQDQKIAGILVELFKNENQSTAIIGIGVNVNMQEALIDQAWTSLAKLSGQIFDRNLLASALLNKLFLNLQIFENQGFQSFQQQWQQFDRLWQKKIKINWQHQIIEGIACGIDEKGYLLVNSDNKLLHIHSGEAFLVK